MTDYGVSIMLLIWCSHEAVSRLSSSAEVKHTHTHTPHTHTHTLVQFLSQLLFYALVQWSGVTFTFLSQPRVTHTSEGPAVGRSVLSAVRSGSLRYTFMEVFPPQCQTVLPQLRFVNVCDYRYSSSKMPSFTLSL